MRYASEKSDAERAAIPIGWALATMGSLGRLLCGTSPTAEEVNRDGRGVPYVTGPEQWDGTTLHMDKWTTAPRRVVPDGCIFVTVKGAGVGTLFPGKSAAIGRDIYAFQPHPEVCVKFVEHALRFTIGDVIRQAQGDIPGLSKRHILDHIMRVPPLAEQVRIADRIDELFTDLAAGVAALERVKRNLSRYRAAVLHAAVTGRLTEAWRKQHGKPKEPGPKLLERILAERRRQWEERTRAKYDKAGKQPPKNLRDRYPEPSPPKLPSDGLPVPELPEGWCWASVDQCADVQGGLQKSPSRAPVKSHYPYLRVANVLRGRLDLAELHRFELAPDELEKLRLEPGDLLIVEGNGSVSEIGRSALWQGEVEDCVHQNHIIRCRFANGILPEYADTYVNSPLGTKYMRGVASSTSGLHTLSVGKVRSIDFPLPPLAEQSAIVEAVNEKLSQIDGLEAEIERGLARASRLRQSILKAAFEGRLVPQDPADEPASVLLERIRAAAELADAPRGGRRTRGAPAMTNGVSS